MNTYCITYEFVTDLLAKDRRTAIIEAASMQDAMRYIALKHRNVVKIEFLRCNVFNIAS